MNFIHKITCKTNPIIIATFEQFNQQCSLIKEDNSSAIYIKSFNSYSTS